MANVLPGFTFDRASARYRNLSTGRYVARSRGPNSIVSLLEESVNSAETRLGNILQGMVAGEVAPGVAQTLMRDELRRLSLQNAALGKGGFDRLDFADYGRVGRQLRDSYQRMTGLLRDMQSGKVSLAQAMNRLQGYTLDARRQFFAAEREAARQSGRQFEERRILHARESCSDCVTYAGMGWQPFDTLPLPGEGNTKCQSFCRCTIERREVTEEAQPTQAERMFA